jgi:hypothetical protein
MISILTHRCKDSNKVCIATPREIMSKSWNSFNINKILSFSKILFSSLGKNSFAQSDSSKEFSGYNTMNINVKHEKQY